MGLGEESERRLRRNLGIMDCHVEACAIFGITSAVERSRAWKELLVTVYRTREACVGWNKRPFEPENKKCLLVGEAREPILSLAAMLKVDWILDWRQERCLSTFMYNQICSAWLTSGSKNLGVAHAKGKVRKRTRLYYNPNPHSRPQFLVSLNSDLAMYHNYLEKKLYIYGILRPNI